MATPEDIKLRISAQNDTKTAFNQVNKDLDKTAITAKKTQTAIMGASKNFGTMGRSAGQAGIQIQQLVGQIQGGTNPMLALSQQSADLGFVLGAPLLGAVGGLAASFAMVLLPALFDTEEATQSLREEIEKLETAFAELTAEQQGTYIRAVQQEIYDLESASASLREEIYATKNGFMAFFDSQEEIDQKVEELTAQLQLNESQIERVKQSLQGYVAGTDESTEANKRLTSSFETLEDQLRAIDAIERSVETPRERMIRQYKEADDLLVKYSLTQETYNRLLMKAKEEYVKTLPVQERVKTSTTELFGETEKLAGAFDDVADKSIGHLEDGLVGLVNGTKSAKEAFRDMALSIVNDLIRMQIQQSITSQLGGIFSGLLGGGATSSASSGIGVGTAASPLAGLSIGAPTAMALGGSVTAGQAYTVGEHGRETFIPSTDGQIVPNGADGGVTINQTINVSTGVQQTVRTEIASLMPQIAAASKQAVLDARKRGGSFGAAFGA